MSEPVYYVADWFATPPHRVRVGYLRDGAFQGRVVPLSEWSQLTAQHQVCLRMCVERLRKGDENPRTNGPHLVVESKSQELGPR